MRTLWMLAQTSIGEFRTMIDELSPTWAITGLIGVLVVIYIFLSKSPLDSSEQMENSEMMDIVQELGSLTLECVRMSLLESKELEIIRESVKELRRSVKIHLRETRALYFRQRAEMKALKAERLEMKVLNAYLEAHTWRRSTLSGE